MLLIIATFITGAGGLTRSRHLCMLGNIKFIWSHRCWVLLGRSYSVLTLYIRNKFFSLILSPCSALNSFENFPYHKFQIFSYKSWYDDFISMFVSFMYISNFHARSFYCCSPGRYSHDILPIYVLNGYQNVFKKIN